MSVEINVWAVLLAGASSMLVGMLYYMPKVFGDQWMHLAKINKDKYAKEMKAKMIWVFVAALVTAEVVAYMTFLYHAYFADNWLSAGVITSLILWLGLSATTLFIHNSLDQRPNHLTYISMGNRLLSLLAMGLIIGWLHP